MLRIAFAVAMLCMALPRCGKAGLPAWPDDIQKPPGGLFAEELDEVREESCGAAVWVSLNINRNQKMPRRGVEYNASESRPELHDLVCLGLRHHADVVGLQHLRPAGVAKLEGQ